MSDYLTQDKVGEAEKQAARDRRAMLKAFLAFQRVRNEITGLTETIQNSVKDFLPEDLAEKFKARLLDPIREKIIAAVSSGLTIDKITAKLNNLKATLVPTSTWWGCTGS